MQEKKTLFVGQIVAQYTLIGHFDLVSTTSRVRALQNLPSAQPASSVVPVTAQGVMGTTKKPSVLKGFHFELPLSKNSV